MRVFTRGDEGGNHLGVVTDLTGLDEFLAQQVARLPAFFDQAPVVIDISALSDDASFDDFPMVVGMLRGHGMIPVGVRGASEAHREQALALELAVMPAGRKIPARGAPATATPIASAGTLLVDQLPDKHAGRSHATRRPRQRSAIASFLRRRPDAVLTG